MTKRERIHQKYHSRCAYCGDVITIKQMEIDHLKPIYRGNGSVNPAFRGTDTEDNMVPACKPCNRWKSTMTVEQFRAELEAQIERLRRDSAAFRMAERYKLVKAVPRKLIFWFETFKS
jgi:5-methylcytosine-specific restriction endonuclease McrA